MEVIIQAKAEVLDFLGGLQQYDERKKYRKSALVITEPVNSDIIAVFNTLTNFCVYLTNEEWENALEKKNEEFFKLLVESYTIIPEKFNEFEVVNEYRKFKQNKNRIEPLKYISSYVILTTTDCNARCFYCYEKGCEKFTMTDETAEKVADFIIGHKNPESNDPIKIGWFGGEPLYNKKVIDIICGRLRDAKVPFENEITSNGILFDESTVQHAKEFWNINSAQITLDGTKDTYNKVKNYIYKEIKNPYEIVLNNIKHLMDNNIRVAVRMNLGIYNYDELKNLIEEIHNRFGNDKNINPYVHEIFDDPKHPRTEEQTKELYIKLKDIYEVLWEYGYAQQEIGGEGIWEHACMADSGSALLINPLGKLSLCEHYANDHLIGDIDTFDEKLNWDEVNLWKEKTHYDVCDSCAIYPYCYKLKLCGGDFCSEEAREAQIYKMKLELRNMIINVGKLNSPALNKDLKPLRNDINFANDKLRDLINDFSRLYERFNDLEKLVKEHLENKE